MGRMPRDVVLRPATPTDLPALGRLGAELTRLHHGFDPRFLSPGADVEEGYAWFLSTQLGQPDVAIYVAESTEDPREVLGYVYASFEPHSWKELREAVGFIHDVVVDERARGQGIARRLVEAAAGWIEARGMPRVMLWTAEKNAAAQRLFERLGFRRTMVEMTRDCPSG
jgi:ribosomal protein S18 acetylase RimI-like enzyme